MAGDAAKERAVQLAKDASHSPTAALATSKRYTLLVDEASASVLGCIHRRSDGKSLHDSKVVLACLLEGRPGVREVPSLWYSVCFAAFIQDG